MFKNMCYVKNIEIYKIKDNVVTPLASSPSESANCSIGDYLIIIDKKVWIKDWNDDSLRLERFSTFNEKKKFSPAQLAAQKKFKERIKGNLWN